MNDNNYCVIMAGGAGSRFWPMSRNNKPKQFLDILGVGKTLLQQTFDRFNRIFPAENIYIVTSDIYKDITLEQLPKIGENQVLLEPARKNTAPCIAYANYKILKKDPNANIVVSPSDHLILNEDGFIETIKKGLEFTRKNDTLLTLGIKPGYPQTGYGYIQVSNEDKPQGVDPNFWKVKTFTEKPDIEMAKVFFESGEFYWNSGIFIWSLGSIMNAFESHLPEVDSLFKEGMALYDTPREAAFINEMYPECKSTSIDYGIMEKAEKVHVLCSDFGWSDLGTWNSLYENSTQNHEGNAITGEVLTYNTSNCVIKAPKDKLFVVEGLDNYIIVESDNVTLICRREQEQEIRQFVNDVKMQKGDKFI